ncbi:unnamed protein product [Amaranthus hypochondriacus]
MLMCHDYNSTSLEKRTVAAEARPLLHPDSYSLLQIAAAADLNAIWIFSVPLSFDVGVPWTTEAELRRLGWASMTEGEIPTSKLCELGFDRWFDRSSSIAVFAGLLQGGDVVGESRMS